MFQALYENGILDNTAIVFTTGHGGMRYDHNHVAKGRPFDSSARLPFILPHAGNLHQGGRSDLRIAAFVMDHRQQPGRIGTMSLECGTTSPLY